MSQAKKLLEKMRRNPVDDWTIEDVETVCGAFGVACDPPQRGSHYKISHPSQVDILTIPARKPVKRTYIDDLVAFIDAVAAATPQEKPHGH